MGKFLLGVFLGVLLTLLLLRMPSAHAFRTSKPLVINEWTPTTFTQLNNFLESMWNLTNGRYADDFTTTNPNGSLPGMPGEHVIYNNSGSYKDCVNVSSSSTGGTTWRCDASALTAP